MKLNDTTGRLMLMRMLLLLASHRLASACAILLRILLIVATHTADIILSLLLPLLSPLLPPADPLAWTLGELFGNTVAWL